MIVDSDILIWYLRGNQRAKSFLESLSFADRQLSILSVMELYQGARNKKELTEIRRFWINHFSEVCPIREEISSLAADLIYDHALPSGLRSGDAIIAATALFHKVPLATANVKHFRSISGLQIHTFRPD